MNQFKIDDELCSTLISIKYVLSQYQMIKNKIRIQETLDKLKRDIEYTLHGDSNTKDSVCNKLESIRNDLISLKGKIGYRDYEMFKDIVENIDSYIVAYALED